MNFLHRYVIESLPSLPTKYKDICHLLKADDDGSDVLTVVMTVGAGEKERRVTMTFKDLELEIFVFKTNEKRSVVEGVIANFDGKGYVPVSGKISKPKSLAVDLGYDFALAFNAPPVPKELN